MARRRKPARSFRLLRLRFSLDVPTIDCWFCLIFTLVTLCVVSLAVISVMLGGERNASVINDKLNVNFSNSPEWNNGASESKWAVFYNVFLSDKPYLAGMDKQIVEEQLQQVGESFANTEENLVVYYVSIGDKLDDEWIHQICSSKYNMTCEYRKHYDSAHEEVTLTELHEYCQMYPDQSVVYMHNKGSLHPNNKGQDRWRRTMTSASTSQMCLEPPNETCNACGLLFQPLPASHFPGNIWMAKCSYIIKLLSPQEYHNKRPIVDQWIRSESGEGIINKHDGLFPMERHYTGKQRYESEHWLGSHPDLTPCDVSKSPNMGYWLEADRNFDKEFQFDIAPRHKIGDDWIFYKYTSNNMTLTEPRLRMRDYFLLRGMIYRWMAFYNRVPDVDSWYWAWFPDAKIWQTAIQSYGALVAVNLLVQLDGPAKLEYPRPSVSQMILELASSMLTLLHYNPVPTTRKVNSVE